MGRQVLATICTVGTAVLFVVVVSWFHGVGPKKSKFPTVSNPKIQAVWSADFANGHIAVTVINQGDQPLEVGRELIVRFGTQGHSVDTFFSFGDYPTGPDVIKPTITLVLPPLPNGHFYEPLPGGYGNGQWGDTIAVAPGESRTLNFDQYASYYVKYAKNADEADLSLFRGATEITGEGREKKNGVWK